MSSIFLVSIENMRIFLLVVVNGCELEKDVKLLKVNFNIYW